MADAERFGQYDPTTGTLTITPKELGVMLGQIMSRLHAGQPTSLSESLMILGAEIVKLIVEETPLGADPKVHKEFFDGMSDGTDGRFQAIVNEEEEVLLDGVGEEPSMVEILERLAKTGVDISKIKGGKIITTNINEDDEPKTTEREVDEEEVSRAKMIYDLLNSDKKSDS